MHYVEHCCRGPQGDARIVWHAQTIEQLLDFAPARLILFAAGLRLLGGEERVTKLRLVEWEPTLQGALPRKIAILIAILR